MQFDVYGRLRLEVVRQDGEWRIFSIGAGLRSPVLDIVVPADLEPAHLRGFLEDIYHEYATPGAQVKQL